MARIGFCKIKCPLLKLSVLNLVGSYLQGMSVAVDCRDPRGVTA